MRKLLLGTLLLASLAIVPSAGAATVQLGQTAPPGTGNGGGCSTCDDLQAATDPASPGYAVPAGDGGVITSWSVLGAPMGTGGPFSAYLLVFSPTSTPGQFTSVNESSVAMPPADGQLHTYATSIVVAPGDVIGLQYTNVPAYFQSGVNAGDRVGGWPCLTTPGTTCTASSSAGRMSVEATLQTPSAAFTPSATSVAPGTSVSFDGSASTSAGTITDYAWNFGDGTTLDTATTATASHTFTTLGAHTVTLTITDSNADTNQASATVTVATPTPTPTPATTTPMTTTPAPFLGSSLGSTKLSATPKGKIALDVLCSATATSSCSDRVDLISATGNAPTVASVHHPRKAARLASAAVTLTSGQTAVAQLALNARGRKLLRRKHFSARVLITATDAGGRSVTTLTAVTVKLAVNKRRHAPLEAAPPGEGTLARFATAALAWAPTSFA